MKRFFLALLMLLVLICLSYGAVVKQWCNIRADHSSKAEIIGKGEPGEEVTILGQYGDWAEIEVLSGDHKGKVGYMSTKGIETDDEGNAYVGGQGWRLREEPSGKSKIICNVGKGKSVNVQELIVTWYKVDFKGIKGWIYKSGIIIK